jgi:hypothetical protein
MGDITSLHAQARKLIVHINAGLEHLESVEVRKGTYRLRSAASSQAWMPSLHQLLNRKHSTFDNTQAGARPGDAASLSRELRAKQTELQVWDTS